MNHDQPDEVYRPALPLAYVQLILDFAQSKGFEPQQLVQGLGLTHRLRNATDARVSRHDAGTILLRAIKLTGNTGMGFEMGLLSSITTHGLVGYGLMASSTLREGINFGRKFLPTRLTQLGLGLDLNVEGTQAVLSVTHSIDLGIIRNHIYEFVLVGIYRLLLQASINLIKEPDVELWCDYQQPKYYDCYAKRLPKTFFRKPANQIRFPAALLDLPMPASNAIAVSQATAHLERELAILGRTENMLARIRAILNAQNNRYPDLEEVAEKLNMSPRTVRRKLAIHGVSFRKILDDMLRREAMMLLANSTMSIEQISIQLGYSAPANFTRAFHRWTLSTPSAYRNQISKYKST